MKENLKKMSDFFAGKGFYIVLVLCVAVIGVSGYQIWQVSNRSVAPVVSDIILEEPVVSAIPTPTVTPSPSAPAVSARPSPTPAEETVATPEPPEEPEVSPKPVASSYVWPVKGSVIADYSLEIQAWDETMGDWRTHEGIDIACELGSVVQAAGAGTVIGVYEDDFMGTTVEIDHGNGVTSLYANLAQAPNVAEGDEVKIGDTIGSVGRTAKAESKRADHLHFEMTKNDERVDPENYLPKQS